MKLFIASLALLAASSSSFAGTVTGTATLKSDKVIVPAFACHTSCGAPTIPNSCANVTAAKTAVAHIGVPICNHPELCAAYDKEATKAIKAACAPPSVPSGLSNGSSSAVP